METQLPDSRKWFTRRRLVVFTCLVLLAGWVSGIWILQPSPLQREVEAVGGGYSDQNLNFPSRIRIANWKRICRGLLQLAQGKTRHHIVIVFHNSDVSDIWARQNAERLKSLPVNFIDFHGTKITDETVTHIAETKNLQALNLSQTSITDQSMSALRKTPKLEVLDLANTNVTAEGIAQLVGHPLLRRISLAGDILTDETVVHLSAMPRLRSLGLKGFSNDQLSPLVGMKKLDVLLLSGATDESLPTILQLSQLRRLILEDSQLSDQSVETIRKTFPNLSISGGKYDEMSGEILLQFTQMLAAQKRLERNVFTAVALGGGCLVLFLVMLWRFRRSRRYQPS